MLNELLEYKQYSYDPATSDEQPQRLKYSNLYDSKKATAPLCGLERAMTIVARQAMFLKSDTAPDVAQARKTLRAWCGGEWNESASGWFFTYVRDVLMQSPEKVLGGQEILSRFAQKAKKGGQFEHSMFYSYVDEYESSKNINDYHCITYDKVLAAAFNAGRLKRRCLIEKKPLAELIGKITPAKCGSLGQTDMDPLYKIISAYLIARERCPENSWVAFNNTDVSNWQIPKDWLEARGKGTQIKWSERYYILPPQGVPDAAKEPVFSAIEVTKNTTKISVTEAVRNNFMLAEEKVAPELIGDVDALCWIDRGAGKEMISVPLKEVLSGEMLDWTEIERRMMDAEDGLSSETPENAGRSCAAITVERLASAGVADREQLLDWLFDAAKRSGLMPDDQKCIREMLRSCGFHMQSAAAEKKTLSELFRCITEATNHRTQVLVQTLRKGDCGVMTLHVLNGGADESPWVEEILQAWDPKNRRSEADRQKQRDEIARILGTITPAHVWLRWDDGADHSPFPRTVPKDSARKKTTPWPETECSRYFQPNPQENAIGDCVLRAIAGALNVSWEEAMSKLRRYGQTTVNARTVFPLLLKDEGLCRSRAKIWNGHYLCGVDFCRKMTAECKNGERIFAYVGRAHVAAILPVQTDGKTVYKLHDSWDSAGEPIKEYWVLKPQPQKKGRRNGR